jgi:hypothetical protein
MDSTGSTRMPLRFSSPPLPIAILLSLALAAAAAAAEAPETLNYGVDVGLAESDNVTLVQTDKVSQTMAIADVDFDVKQQSRLYDVDAKGNFTYLDYLQNAYGSQVIGRFDGVGHVAIIPGHLTWTLQDDFGQAAVDPFTPVVPTNLENVNYVSTGPDLALRLSATNFVDLSARVAHVEFETSPYNSNRFLGNLAWGLQLSAATTVSLNANTEKVLFENTVLNTDFERTSAFVRYELQGARTDFSVDLGATEISQGGANTSGPLAKIALTRKISAAAALTVSAGRDLTDASTSFSGLQGGAVGLVGAAPAAVTGNSYTRTYVSAGWQYQRNRTTISVSGRWEKDTYAGAPGLDLKLGGAEFRVERKLTHTLNLQIVGRLYKTDYVNGETAKITGLVTPINGSSNYNNSLLGAALTWRHGRALEVKLRCEHNSQVVTTGFNNGYAENRVLLTVGYRPIVNQPDNGPGA